MAMNIDVNTDAEDAIRKSLEAAGEITEEVKEEKPSEESEGKPFTEVEEKPPKETAKETIAAASDGATKETKKEETQTLSTEESWDSLPEFARKKLLKLQTKNRELRDMIEDERAARTTAPAGGSRETAKETKDDLKPETTYSGVPEPVFENFEKADDPYRDFIKAHSKWAKDEAVAQVRSEMAVRDQVKTDNQIGAAFDRRLTEMLELITDYGDVLEEATELKASPVMERVIKTSDVGPAILYHLAKNPDECKRIFALAPADALRAMGRLEAKVEIEVEALKAVNGKKGTESPKKKTVSSAPEPEKPIRGSEPKVKTDREMAGSSDRIVDMVKYNPEIERARNARRQ